MQTVCNELDSQRCDPDNSTCSFLSVLCCICRVPSYFITPLFIFHTRSLLSFFVFFLSRFDLVQLGGLFPFLSSALFLLSKFPFSRPFVIPYCLIICLFSFFVMHFCIAFFLFSLSVCLSIFSFVLSYILFLFKTPVDTAL